MVYEITEKTQWIRINNTIEGDILLPADCEDLVADYEADTDDIERVEGHGARLSMPGYMDCTEWTVFDTREEAAQYLLDTYFDTDPEFRDEYENDQIEELETIIDNAKKIAELVNDGELRAVKDRDALPNLESPQYEIRLTAWGDYGGDTITRSNHRALLEAFPFLGEKTGGYSSSWLILSEPDCTPELLDALEALQDYPLYSDDDHSDLEWEIECEQWESFWRDEIKRAFYPLAEQVIPSLQDWALFDLPNETIDLFFFEAMEGEETWIHEDAVSVWINADMVAKRMIGPLTDMLTAIEIMVAGLREVNNVPS
jgi:hypothetical protein